MAQPDVPHTATIDVLPVDKSVDAFMHEDLARSGLTAAEIGATLEKTEFGGLVGYRIPYYLPDGTVHPQMYRVRLSAPGTGGKYSQPPKSVFAEGSYPYLPPVAAHASLARDADNPPLIVEGEKKCLAAIKLLRRVAYGIGGCWNWTRPHEEGTPHRAHPDLLERFRPGEVVEVVMDGDVLTNMEVQRAAGTLRLRLVEAGLKPVFVLLPVAKKGRCGLDDFLMDQHALGANVVEAFAKLPRISGRTFLLAHVDLYDALGLTLQASGQPYANERNAELLLRGHPRLGNLLRFERVTGRFELRDPDTGEVAVNPDNMILSMFQGPEVGIPRMTGGVVRAAMVSVREAITQSAVAEYLEAQAARWDQQPRVDLFLANIFKLPISPYLRAVSRTFFIQAAQRAMRPGCKADYVLVLSGRGGVGKTTLIQAIATSPAWASELVSDLTTKDGQLALTSGWIVELSEGVSHGITSSDTMKAIITRTIDTVRPPYEAKPVSFPRSTVMVVTTNDSAMLKFEAGSGNRRFLVVDVGAAPADLDLVAQEIDQVWGEACVRARAGEAYWMGLEQQAAEFVERHTAADPWIEVIEDFLANPINTTLTRGLPFVSSSALREVALQIPNAQLHAGVNKRLQRVMDAVDGGAWKRYRTANGRGFAKIGDDPTNGALFDSDS